MMFLSLMVFAGACGEARSDATATVEARGYDGEALWYTPGADDTLLVSSDDTGLARWSIESVDDGVAALEPTFSLDGKRGTRVAGGAVGDGAVRVYDDVDALVTEIPVFVRNPDTITVTNSCGGLACAVGPTVRVLRGDPARFGIGYDAGGHFLHGDDLLVVAQGGDRGAAVLHELGDELEISSSDEPYSVVLAAGPDAHAELAVENVAPSDASAQLVVDEPAGIAALSLRDSAGHWIYSSGGTWTLGGVPVDTRHVFLYQYDPAAAPVELRVTVGALSAWALVHVAS